MSSEAFVTLATTDGYGLGALVLAESIRQVGTKRSLVVLISNHLSDLIRRTLEISFDEVIVVDELNSNDIQNLKLLSRPELGITFTKINCWLLEQYSKCVFLDADCVVLRPIDDLFQREQFSAAPDAGWPDCFNSGVFVYQPSKDTFNKLTLFASQQNASFDGGDQGLLNAYFSNWRSGDISRHLPFTYNVTANAFYSYLPAVTRFRNDIHLVHFAGALKPWQLSYNPQNEQLSGNLGGQNDIQRDFLLSWWRVMYQRVWPNIEKLNQKNNSNTLNIEENQFGGDFVGLLNYGNLTDNKGIQVGSVAHRRAWEAGHIDYFGRDSFYNIQQQLERNIQLNTNGYHPSQQRQITPEKTTTTSILKNSNKELTPPLQQTNINQTSLRETTPPTQTSTNISQHTTHTNQTSSTLQQHATTNNSQHLSKQQPTANVTQNVIEYPPNVVKSSLTQPTSTLQQQQQPTQSTTGLKSVLKESTQSFEQQPTANVTQNVTEYPANVLRSSLTQPTSTLQQQQQQPTQSTTGLKSVLKESTPSFEQQPTANVTQNVTEYPTNVLRSSLTQPTSTLQQQPTSGLKSVLKESSQSSEQQPTANVSQNVIEYPPNVVKSSLTQPSSRFEQESTSGLKSALKETTQSFGQQPPIHVTQNVIEQPTNLLIRSSLTEATSQQQRTTTNASQNLLKEQQQTIQSPIGLQSTLKESKQSFEEPSVNMIQHPPNPIKSSSSHTQRENHQSLFGSNNSNGNKSPSSEHQSNWTVKSTIVTAYTPGGGDDAGTTVVTKAFSESTATSSNNSPIKTTIKPITDSTNSSGLNLTAKTSNDHFAWLFDKLFVAITYTISLCYLLFLVAIRRSKNTDVIHGNVTSVRGVIPSTNNGNRVNK